MKPRGPFEDVDEIRAAAGPHLLWHVIASGGRIDLAGGMDPLIEGQKMHLSPGSAGNALGLGPEEPQGLWVDRGGGVESDHDPRSMT